MKTKTAASPAASTSASGATKPTRPLEPVAGLIRVPGWPACLADKAIAAQLEAAVYEGYEQERGAKTGLYRVR